MVKTDFKEEIRKILPKGYELIEDVDGFMEVENSTTGECILWFSEDVYFYDIYFPRLIAKITEDDIEISEMVKNYLIKVGINSIIDMITDYLNLK